MAGREIACVDCRQHLNQETVSVKLTGERHERKYDRTSCNDGDDPAETGHVEAGSEITDQSGDAGLRVDVKCLSYEEESQLLAVAFEG